MTYEFKPITEQYMPQVLNLFLKYKNVLTDDYHSKDPDALIIQLINFIKKLHPHFYVCLKGGDFLGFVYVNEWRGGQGKYHSCFLTCCTERKYWGRSVLDAGHQFIKLVFERYKVKKIKAEVYKHNTRAMKFFKRLGFTQEAELQNETIIDGQPVDTYIFSIKGNK